MLNIVSFLCSRFANNLFANVKMATLLLEAAMAALLRVDRLGSAARSRRRKAQRAHTSIS